MKLRLFALMTVFTMGFLVVAPSVARAEAPYFEVIAQAYGEGTRVWSDDERRSDAFNEDLREEFDQMAFWLSDEENDNRLPYGLEVFVAQVDYDAAKAATEDGLSPNEELEKAVRAEFGYEGNLLIVIIDGDQLDVRAYGDDLPRRLLQRLDGIMMDVNENENNWADPQGLFRSWFSLMDTTNWDNVLGGESAEPLPEPAKEATTSATPTASPSPTASADTRTPAEVRGHPMTVGWAWVIGIVCAGIVAIPIALTIRHSSRQ